MKVRTIFIIESLLTPKQLRIKIKKGDLLQNKSPFSLSQKSIYLIIVITPDFECLIPVLSL